MTGYGLKLEYTPPHTMPEALPANPDYLVFQAAPRKNCARGSPPKSRYSGHQNSRLMRGASKHEQTNRLSYYMREGRENKREGLVRLKWKSK